MDPPAESCIEQDNYGGDSEGEGEGDEYYENDDEEEEDALASEIAQLEQELEYLTPYEVGLTTERHVSLQRAESQRDYVVTDAPYPESEDEAAVSMEEAEELLSTILDEGDEYDDDDDDDDDRSSLYDEVTVSTAELLAAGGQLSTLPQKQQQRTKNDVLRDLQKNQGGKERTLLQQLLTNNNYNNNDDDDDDSHDALFVPPSLRVAHEPGGSPVKQPQSRHQLQQAAAAPAVSTAPPLLMQDKHGTAVTSVNRHENKTTPAITTATTKPAAATSGLFAPLDEEPKEEEQDPQPSQPTLAAAAAAASSSTAVPASPRTTTSQRPPPSPPKLLAAFQQQPRQRIKPVSLSLSQPQSPKAVTAAPPPPSVMNSDAKASAPTKSPTATATSPATAVAPIATTTRTTTSNSARLQQTPQQKQPPKLVASFREQQSPRQQAPPPPSSRVGTSTVQKPPSPAHKRESTPITSSVTASDGHAMPVTLKQNNDSPATNNNNNNNDDKKKVKKKVIKRKVRKRSTTTEEAATLTANLLTPEEQAVVTNYQKMLKIGMPEALVRQRMVGVDPKIVDAVFAATPVPPTSTGNRGGSNATAMTPPQPTVEPDAAGSGTDTTNSLTPEEENTASEFRKMFKIGLPEAAVRQRMAGVDPKIVKAVFVATPVAPPTVPASNGPSFIAQQPPPASVPSRTSSAAASLTPEEENRANEFRKLLKIGMPEPAVRQRMVGVDPKIVEAVIAGTAVPEPLPPTSRQQQQQRPPQPQPKITPAASAVATPQSTLPSLTDEEQAVVDNFQKMLQIGLPEGAVRHRMEMVGADSNPKVVAAVFANEAPPSSSRMVSSSAPTTELTEEAKLDAEIQRVEAELRAAEVPPDARPSMGILLGHIAQAATQRVNRLEETGGELVMQEIAPEVEAKQQTSTQLSTSMAEMISARATAREKRLADGGEKRMRKVVIKEKDEYKKDFSNIVTDAASMGRLTRLDEHTVEAVAGEKTPEQEWRSNGLLAIQWRSNHMSVIHEAAKVGNEYKLPEHIVSNCPEEENEGWDPEANEKRLSPRMRQLLELNTQVGEGQQKVDNLVLGRKENKVQEHLLIKPMQAYSNVEDVKLPRKTPPKVDPGKNAERLSKMKQEALRGERPMEDISLGVAERAWERRARLDRPGSLPKVKENCNCPYCGTASPYQTFAYRELERKHKKEMEELEHKRLERKRIRAEKRKLQKAVAEAEAAVAEARAKAEEEAARRRLEEEAAAALAREREPPGQILPMEVEDSLPATAIQESESSDEPENAPSVVQARVEQWNSIPAEKLPYTKRNPAEAGCGCAIM